MQPLAVRGCHRLIEEDAAMKSGRVILLLALVMSGCQAAPRAHPARPATGGATAEIPEAPGDPSEPPPHLIATFFLGEPRVLRDALDVAVDRLDRSCRQRVGGTHGPPARE
jgi:hypothetical protein